MAPEQSRAANASAKAWEAPETRWKSRTALHHAREVVLEFARGEQARRRQAAAASAPTASFQEMHTGRLHLEFFRSQFPQIQQTLSENFDALEWGSGMGWHAALLAAHGAGRVVATDVGWTNEVTPYWPNNVQVMHHLAVAEPGLKRAVHFENDEHGNPARMRIDRVVFAHASAEAIPVADASLDFLTSYNVMEHLASPDAAFAEASRALRVGGQLFFATEPLYFSAFGHHCREFFPLPWGHLLWPLKEFVEIVLRETEQGRELEPGIPLNAEHLQTFARDILNFATPADLRCAMRRGPWSVLAWVDVVPPELEALAKEARLADALLVPLEALLLEGLIVRLRRDLRPPAGLRSPLRLSFLTRRKLRVLKPIFQIVKKS